MEMGFDIVVVGAGPAGLSTAKAISTLCDANILIVEKKKSLGYPPLSSAFTFADFEREYQLGSAVLNRYSKLGFYSYLGSKVIYDLGETSLVTLDYERLCWQLLNSSKKDKIELWKETTATDLQRKNEKISLKCKGSHNETVNCDLLIDASGACFLTAKSKRFRIPRFYSHPYGYELENCDIPETSLDEISFFMGKSIGTGGGWFYPLSKVKCRFGIAEISHRPNHPSERLREKCKFAKENMLPFAKMIEDATPCGLETGVIPADPMKKMALDNVMRVGDSAGQATPHMLEGIRPSIHSGALCGSVAAEAYLKHDFSKNSLKKYEKMWQSHCRNSHLYLLSRAEVAFSRNDIAVEKAISIESLSSAKSPEACLQGLKGYYRFPHTLVGHVLNPYLIQENLKILGGLAYHYLTWLIE